MDYGLDTDQATAAIVLALHLREENERVNDVVTVGYTRRSIDRGARSGRESIRELFDHRR